MIVLRVAVLFDSCGLPLVLPSIHILTVQSQLPSRLESNLWFSFNFDSSIISFIMSAAFGCPVGALASVPPAGFAGTGTVPLFEALPPAAGDVVVCWAKDETASDVAANKLIT